MSKLIVRCLFFVVWFVNLDCQNNLIRPKIITQNGDIIIEAALNKNIVLRPNGPNSAVLVGDLNILQKTTSKSGDQYQSSNSNNFETYFSGPNSIIERLERLENQTAAFTFNTNLRPSTNINRKINRLINLVNTLQRRIEEITSDECESNPCQKGGTCLNLANGYHCLCPSNWEGKNCDIDVNECRNFAGTDLGCQNGATCINRPGTYECFCAAGWYGLHCTRREKDCSQGNYEMCGHGTCIPSTSGKGFTCICDQGWETNGTGLECLTDVNECDARNGPRCSVNPKVECVNWPGSFRCGQCPTGYEGDGFTCSDINECLTIPNGGCSPLVTCHNTVGSRICGPCPQGYQGDGLTCTWRGSCNINHGGCHPSAQCVENMSTVQCVCPFGMDGDGIGTHGCYISTYGNISRRCDDNPCGNHGQCHQLMTGYTCLCFKGYSGAHCDVITDSCSSNPCRNGGTCRSENSISGFSCECPAQYTGHLCGMKVRTCGGYLDSEEGSIVHPLTNTSYSHNNKCAWVIHTLSNKVINVTFSKFDLEPEPECLYDFLQIHDGRTSSSQLIGRFCGSQLPNGGKIVSSHNYLYFWFRSDDSRAGSGFALHWNSIDPICGGEVNASTHGVISSPGSPGNYPPNRDCFWYLSTSPSKRISLAFFTLDIESHANCSFDYLTIYNGRRSSDPLINKYCNSTQPQPTTSTSSDVMIHFHSDSQGSGHGFQISYAPIEGIPGCGGMYTLDRGEIISPSYNGRYLNNLRCEYKITTEADSKIRIDFKSFELESSHKCRYDYVKVYDGPSTESKLIGKFCGKGYPKHSILSSSNNLVIIFRTDHNINSGGFKIAFESICQKLLSGDSGVITSPGYPFSYPPNKVCEYIIGTVPGKAIQLTFQDFNLEDSRFYNCRYDYVEIRDGPDSNSTSIGKFCGAQHLPPTQLSTHNYLYMRFKSDISNPSSHLFNGFYANYTTIKTECGGIFKETTGSISHPSTGEKYKNSQHCNWFLIAPEGMSIQLTWNSFHLESSVQCRNDFLELVEVDSSNKKDSIGKYCGSRSPPSLTTTTSRLLIKFESDSSLMFSGFTVAYQFLDTSKSCGGIYVKTHGFIYSPGWPKRYPNNQDCTWTIHVPVGQQITLNISQFNIEQSHMNKCDLGDYLEVRNGITAVSPLIGKYCGSFTTKSITSMGNALYIRFYSDFYMAGNGFMIEWKSAATLCGGTLTSSSGSITSPNYPEKYNNNEECFYKIITSHGSRIKISFLVLELENTPSCRDDYVEIFDGIDDNSPSLGRHCYMSTPLDNLQTTSNVAFIKFRTDFYTSGKGFSLNYFTICQNNVTGTYGVIESPDYPGNYPTYSNCLWTINVPKGHTINITFSHFDVFADSPWRFALTRSFVSCLDYVQFKELNQLDFTKKYCGIEKPRIHHTNSNSLQIKFISGSYFTKSGFRLEWVSVGCGGKITKQFGSLNLEKNATTGGEMECLWIIEAPLGRKVTIEFKNVYMSDTHNCSMDAIEILNGPDINSPLISKFCSDFKDLHKFQSSSNYMLVRFVKRSDLKDVHFQSSFSTYEKGCGGTIRSHSGIIYSPNYPNNYDNDLDCVWTITVPKNHRIELNFIFFDLYALDYSRESCSDSIRVFDSKIVTTSNYTRIICANSHVSQIVSKSNNMALQFITDNSGTAKGFKANFTVTCGATIIATFDGLISNEKYVSLSNRSCTWTIKAPRLDQKITLTITHMSIPKTYTTNATNAACHPSFLRVLEGDDENAPLVNEYCGSYTPRIVSRGSALTVVLGTYSDRIEGQFTAHYSSVDNTCGGSLTSENGEVASPNYPSPYPPNSDCEWTLYTSPGNRVYMNFETFDLENSEDCNQDYVEIRENNDAGLLLGVYCGSNIPRNTTIASKLYVKFRSDGTGSSRGFMFRFGFLHGNDITGLQKGDVASPLYPYPFKKPGEYTWRITVPENKITLTISHLEIHTRGDTCTNSLVIYDGYDEDAPILENVCGVLRDNKKNIQSSFNVILIKLSLDESNMGALFYIRWAEAGVVEPDTTSEENHINCGSSVIQLVVPGNISYFSTPNYPNHYDDSSNCEWIYRTSNGRHLELDFLSFQLEERPRCYADSVSVYSSLVSTNWKPVKTQFCLKEESVGLNASKFMKINFASDSSVTAKGFQGRVTSVCGGVFNDLSGTVSPSWFDWKYSYGERTCDWVVRVRPGRQISLRFLSFNITSVNNQCSTYVVLRNGETLESPLLSSGKYCGYEHEVRDNIETTGNSLFVRFKTTGARTQNYKTFVLWYEEKNIECGGTSSLTNEHNWEIINSPNFPSVPIPYTECVWSFSGPPGRTLSIDFIDRFDIDSKSSDCSTEYVEVRDGSTELSPSLGRFCTEKPGTIKSKNNLLFVKYSTQISEPRNGFKANVSIDICGGTIIAVGGELSSPGYPHMAPTIPYGTVCTWHLIGKMGHTFMIKVQDINLPDPESPCATKVTIEEMIPENNTFSHLKTYCSELLLTPLNSVVQTLTNNVTIKLHFGKPSLYSQLSQVRGFRLTFNSSMPLCTEVLTAPQGILSTPSYPRLTTIRYCHWIIDTPDEGRRITLELKDFDPLRQRIGIYSANDRNSFATIQNIPGDDYLPSTKIYESTSNSLILYVWLDAVSGSTHRFQAEYNSDSPALCGGTISGSSGNLISPNLNRSYSCKWHYYTELPNINSTIVIKLQLNSSTSRIRCRRIDSRLSILYRSGQSKLQNIIKICGHADTVYRIPSNAFQIGATKKKRDSLYFSLDWNTHPCGGSILISESLIDILNIPSTFNDTLDCAWVISVPVGNRVELTLGGTFQFECEDEFLKIHPNDDEQLTIGDYCKDKTQDSPLLVSFSKLYVEYHSKPRNNSNIKLMGKLTQNQCGSLMTNEATFSSPNYPKQYPENIECAWEIKTDLAFRVSLKFIGRFAIEGGAGSCKDAVIIYDWKEDAYTEIARLCGRDPPRSYNSTFNRMKVVFRSNDQINLDGFQAQWTHTCGGDYNATEKEQFLYSPGFPNMYPPSMQCVYTIKSNSERSVYVKFIDFELEGVYPECENDNLTINAEGQYDFVHETYCGSNHPELLFYKTVTVTFRTDRYISRKGFKLSYWVTSCGGEIKEPTVISSGPIGTYDSNLNCTWKIEGPQDKNVVLTIINLDLESSYNCYNDYIAIYEGLVINDNKRLALLCGKHDNSSHMVIKSTNYTMLLNFISDFFINAGGFKVAISFSYSTAVGCGGNINLTSPTILKSPLIGSHVVYENYLDCVWLINAPENHVIKLNFNSFHVAPCQDVNQTALGINTCDCDYVQLRDGIQVHSMIINQYCGHTQPMEVVSSGNSLSVIFHTDGEVTSSGFEMTLNIEESVCGQSDFLMTNDMKHILSPNYQYGSVPRGLHCVYNLILNNEYEYYTTYIHINYLDLQSGTIANRCDRDNLVISKYENLPNSTLGTDYVINKDQSLFLENAYLFEQSDTVTVPSNIVLCGIKESLDIYVTGRVSLRLQTTPLSESDHRGFDIEIRKEKYCTRNFSEPYGRIKYGGYNELNQSCYTLITVPENHTVSAYFISTTPLTYDEKVFIKMYDGNTTSSELLKTIDVNYDDIYTAFSTGRYMLIYAKTLTETGYSIGYDMTYVSSERYPGCGGKLVSEIGRITSPAYPDKFQQKATCVWELETPPETRLLLRFTTFDFMISACDQVYLQLFDRNGDTISEYCEDSPADYTSPDNYVKVVLYSSKNNGGQGFIANFVGIV